MLFLKPSIDTSGVGTAPVGKAMAGPKCFTFYSNDMIYCFKNNKVVIAKARSASGIMVVSIEHCEKF